MQHARDRLRELTSRKRPWLPDEAIVADMNRVLRGWAQFFRYGNSARHFDVIRNYALMRLTLVIAKRHQRTRAYGRSVLFFQSPDHLGLVKLDGTVVAPDPSGTGGERRMPAVNDVGEPCAGEPHAWFEAAGAGNGATWPRPPEWDSLAGTAGTPKAPGPTARPAPPRQLRTLHGGAGCVPLPVSGAAAEGIVVSARGGLAECRLGWSPVTTRPTRPLAPVRSTGGTRVRVMRTSTSSVVGARSDSCHLPGSG
jgi:hypothetical protein